MPEPGFQQDGFTIDLFQQTPYPLGFSDSFFLITFIINVNVQFFIKKSRQRAVGGIEYPARTLSRTRSNSLSTCIPGRRVSTVIGIEGAWVPVKPAC